MKRQREESWEMLILGSCAGNNNYIYYLQKLLGQNELNGMRKNQPNPFYKTSLFKLLKETKEK